QHAEHDEAQRVTRELRPEYREASRELGGPAAVRHRDPQNQHRHRDREHAIAERFDAIPGYPPTTAAHLPTILADPTLTDWATPPWTKRYTLLTRRIVIDPVRDRSMHFHRGFPWVALARSVHPQVRHGARPLHPFPSRFGLRGVWEHDVFFAGRR